MTKGMSQKNKDIPWNIPYGHPHIGKLSGRSIGHPMGWVQNTEIRLFLTKKTWNIPIKFPTNITICLPSRVRPIGNYKRMCHRISYWKTGGQRTFPAELEPGEEATGPLRHCLLLPGPLIGVQSTPFRHRGTALCNVCCATHAQTRVCTLLNRQCLLVDCADQQDKQIE